MCSSDLGDPDLSLTLGTGESQSLQVDALAYARSVHGSALNCTACHPGFGEQPHPTVNTASRAEFRAAFRGVCKTCHLENDRKAHDGVHWQLLAAGDTRAPYCADCHTAHAIAPPARPRARISQTCAQCHPAVVAAYRASVHGRALLDGNPDVPACTDCHRAHDIKDPQSTVIRANLVRTCRKCHAGAGESFPAAWLSHYEPSPSKAPLVYGVRVFYRAFIPFVIGGLVLQMGLHVLRHRKER